MARTRSIEAQKKENKRRAKAVTDWRIRSKQKLVEHFGGECKLCGYNKAVQALTFHHLDPTTKKFAISGRTYGYEVLLEEAKKCIMICMNCHAEVHAGVVLNEAG